jgi:hypothetical protein
MRDKSSDAADSDRVTLRWLRRQSTPSVGRHPNFGNHAKCGERPIFFERMTHLKNRLADG